MNKKILFSFIPVFILGMLFQNQAEKIIPSVASAGMMVESNTVEDATARLQIDAPLNHNQKIFSGKLSYELVQNVLDGVDKENEPYVYVRLGLVNNKLSFFIGNNQLPVKYATPSMDGGFCPLTCPHFN